MVLSSTTLSGSSSDRSTQSVATYLHPLSPYVMEARSHKASGRRNRDDNKLIKLISKRRWLEFSDLISALAAKEKADGLSTAMASVSVATMGTGALVHITYGDYQHGNLLHVLCQHHPPSKLVHKVATMYPLLVLHVNRLKQTPLHIAAAYGASHRVIAMLLRHSVSAAAMQDVKGKTPLHLHVEKTTSNKICDSLTTSEDDDAYLKKTKKALKKELCVGPDTKVLRRLAESSPASLILREERGQTPIDLSVSMGPEKIKPNIIEAMKEIRQRFVEEQSNSEQQSAKGTQDAVSAAIDMVSSVSFASNTRPCPDRPSGGPPVNLQGFSSDGTAMKNKGTLSLNRYLRKAGRKQASHLKKPRSKSETLGIRDEEADA